MNPMGDNSLGKFINMLGFSGLSTVGGTMAVIPAWAGSMKEYISIGIWVIGIVGTILYAFSLYLDIEKKIREKHEAQEAKLAALKQQIEEEQCKLRRQQGRCPMMHRQPFTPEDMDNV